MLILCSYIDVCTLSGTNLNLLHAQVPVHTHRHADTEEVDKLCDQLEPCVAEKAELTQTLELGQKDQKVYMTHGLISWDRTKGVYCMVGNFCGLTFLWAQFIFESPSNCK